MTSFKTEFAVAMTCEACVKDVQATLRNESGVTSYDVDLKAQRVIVEGTAPPSRVARALKETGKQVIVRGAGTADGAQDAAAVCLFDFYTPPAGVADPDAGRPRVYGIARLVQAAQTTLLDLTVRHPLLAGRPHECFVAATGDVTDGARSTGAVWRRLGRLEPADEGAADGYAELFTEVDRLQLWEIIGRSLVIAPVEAPAKPEAKLGVGLLAGIVARSAGLWGTAAANDKTVCSCTGLTMWQEQKLAEQQGFTDGGAAHL